MPRKNDRNTRGRIISAAWKLFYDQGYASTTIEDIIFESETSRGSFYHYFKSKDDLLGTLAYVFDEEYQRLEGTLEDDWSTRQKLIFLNSALFRMIEERISRELLTKLLSTQLNETGEKHLLDRNRTYFRLLRTICAEGAKRGEFLAGMSAEDIVKAYALWERALLYDWCLHEGEYSLTDYTDRMTPLFLAGLMKNSD